MGSGLAVCGAAFGAARFLLPADGPVGPGDIAVRIVAAIGGIYLVLLLAIHLLIVRRRGVGWRQIGFRPAAARWYVVAAAALALWWLASVAVYHVFGQWDEAMAYQREALMPVDFGWPLLVPIALSVGPMAALLEETLFRGLIFQWLRRRLPLAAAAAISAFLFALAHFNYLVPGGPTGVMMTVEIFVIGATLAVIFERSGSLWPGVVLHAANNLLVLGSLASG